MLTPRHALTAFAALSLASFATGTGSQGSDWPRLRGPAGTGVSPETGWSAKGQPEPLWTKSLGVGHSSFAVAGSKLYAMGYDAARGVDVVYCLEAESGKELWTHTYPAEIWDVGHEGGTCTTPTLEGDSLFTTNREGKVFSLNAETGSVEWSRDLAQDHDLTPPRWGFCASPLLADDTLVINFGHVVGLDRDTGETWWVTEKTYGSAYSTPSEFDYLGTPAVLALNGTGLAVINRTDGSEITFHSWSRDPELAVYGATPIIWDGKIFLSSAYMNGCALLEPTSAGLEVVWENTQMRTSYSGCVVFEDHLYGFDRAILKCIDLDGKPKWRERGIGLGAMSIVGGRLLVVGAKGEIIIAEANPEKYVELSRETVMEGGAYWSTPVLSHGLVYARNSLGHMVCLDHREGATALAAERRASPTELPDAAALLTGHVEALGGADALRQLSSVHFTGRGEQHGNGPIDFCEAELAWSEDGTSVFRFSTGFELGLNPEICWTVSTLRGGRLLQQSSYDNLKESLDLHRMLAPNWGFEKLQTTQARVFDDRMCYVVKATRTDGIERTLYIDVDSGLLAGQEGEDTSLWIYADYQDAGGVLLPMTWSFYPLSSGVMTRATFSSVSLKAEPSALEPAKLIQLMTASDEQKASEDERLRAAYSHLVGDYSFVSGEMDGTQAAIVITDGGIQFSLGGGPGAYIDEPDAEDRMYDLANRGQWIQLERDESGLLTPTTYFMYNEEFGGMESSDNK